MQFIMKPSISFDSYEMALFDSVKDSVDVTKITSAPLLDAALRKARSFLGQDGYLNPIRGKNVNGNYYLTFLRYAYYGYATANDIRSLDQHYTASQTGVSKHVADWTSMAKSKTEDVVKTDYLYNTSQYNIIAPIPTIFSSISATVSIYGPRYKVKNRNSSALNVNTTYNMMRMVQPNVSNVPVFNYGYNSGTPITLAPEATTDWLYPKSDNGFSTGTAYMNLKSENDVYTTAPPYLQSDAASPHDGLVYLRDFSTQTIVSSLPTDVVNIDIGMIWFDATRCLKLTAGDWTLMGSTDPGSRPKLALNSFNQAISL